MNEAAGPSTSRLRRYASFDFGGYVAYASFDFGGYVAYASFDFGGYVAYAQDERGEVSRPRKGRHQGRLLVEAEWR